MSTPIVPSQAAPALPVPAAAAGRSGRNLSGGAGGAFGSALALHLAAGAQPEGAVATGQDLLTTPATGDAPSASGDRTTGEAPSTSTPDGGRDDDPSDVSSGAGASLAQTCSVLTLSVTLPAAVVPPQPVPVQPVPVQPAPSAPPSEPQVATGVAGVAATGRPTPPSGPAPGLAPSAPTPGGQGRQSAPAPTSAPQPVGAAPTAVPTDGGPVPGPTPTVEVAPDAPTVPSALAPAVGLSAAATPTAPTAWATPAAGGGAVPVATSARAAAPAQPGPQAVPQLPSPLLAEMATPQPVSAAPAPAQGQQPFAQQLGAPVLRLAASPAGEHVLTVHVAPDHLGPVTVQARIDAGGVRIELFSPTDAGRAAVHAALPDLRRDLAGAGLGASLDLSHRDAPAGQPSQGGDHGTLGDSAGQRGGSRGAVPLSRVAADSRRQTSTPSPRHPSSSLGVLDVLA